MDLRPVAVVYCIEAGIGVGGGADVHLVDRRETVGLHLGS
jgi:hypothetical protein